MIGGIMIGGIMRLTASDRRADTPTPGGNPAMRSLDVQYDGMDEDTSRRHGALERLPMATDEMSEVRPLIGRSVPPPLPAPAQRALTFGLLLSAFRCTVQYIVLP